MRAGIAYSYYYYYGYIGNLYCLEFVSKCMWVNMILTDQFGVAYLLPSRPFYGIGLPTRWRQRQDIASTQGCAEWRGGGGVMSYV